MSTFFGAIKGVMAVGKFRLLRGFFGSVVVRDVVKMSPYLYLSIDKIACHSSSMSLSLKLHNFVV